VTLSPCLDKLHWATRAPSRCLFTQIPQRRSTSSVHFPPSRRVSAHNISDTYSPNRTHGPSLSLTQGAILLLRPPHNPTTSSHSVQQPLLPSRQCPHRSPCPPTPTLPLWPPTLMPRPPTLPTRPPTPCTYTSSRQANINRYIPLLLRPGLP